MKMQMLLIMLLVLVPAVLQLMAISVYTERLARAIRRSSDKPPFTTTLVLLDLGPRPRAVARLLDRATRLDDDEVDRVITGGGGPLPLPMSRPAALRLLHELRQLGASAEARYDMPRSESVPQ
jgi:hypothetical protein